MTKGNARISVIFVNLLLDKSKNCNKESLLILSGKLVKLLLAIHSVCNESIFIIASGIYVKLFFEIFKNIKESLSKLSGKVINSLFEISKCVTDDSINNSTNDCDSSNFIFDKSKIIFLLFCCSLILFNPI